MVLQTFVVIIVALVAVAPGAMPLGIVSARGSDPKWFILSIFWLLLYSSVLSVLADYVFGELK